MQPNKHTIASLNAALAQARQKVAAGMSKATISDGGGLLLVVQGQASASWTLRTQVDGRRRDIKLGEYPAMSLKDARLKAFSTRNVVQQPAHTQPTPAHTQDSPAHTSGADTLDRMMEDWLKTLDVSAVYEDDIRKAMKADVLPVLGKRDPATITRPEVDAILRTIEARGSLSMVRRVRMWLAQLFEFGIDDERRPGVITSPVRQGRMSSFKAPSRGHFPAITDPAEVPSLMRAIRHFDSTKTRTCLLLSAYLWQRPSEIREAEVSEFRLDEAKWVIPGERMKGKREHWVPLPRQVVELLRDYIATLDGVLLFPGQGGDKPISEATVEKALHTMGYKGKHCPHGFRAMARTITVERLKVDKRVAEKHLSHEHDSSDAHRGAYDRAEWWEERVKMIQAWADWLDAQR